MPFSNTGQGTQKNNRYRTTVASHNKLYFNTHKKTRPTIEEEYERIQLEFVEWCPLLPSVEVLRIIFKATFDV